MIKYIENGNIFNSQADILTNPVNTKGVMGAGLALDFKNRYPRMFRAYRRACWDWRDLSIGVVQFYIDGNICICNFPTKFHWRDKSNIEDIEMGLKTMLYYLETNKENLTIALPKLGCGLGGLSWKSEVKPLFSQCLTDSRHTFEVYI